MEKFLRAVLILSLLALAVLTPVWWLGEHPRAAALRSAPPPSAEPTPLPTADPEALNALRYEAALELYWNGDCAAALPILEELDGFRESRALAESCREALYAPAMEALYRRDLPAAAELLRALGDYKDCAAWLRYCEKHAHESAPAQPLLNKHHVYYKPRNGLGLVYTCTDGMFYIPNEIGPDTKVLLYYPGGSVSTEKSLDSDVACDFASRYAPDAVCFFAYTCDYHRIPEKNRETWAVMEQLMRECGIVPHEVYLVGTSNGFYTAMDLALQLLENEGLPVRLLMSWDAGEDWKVPDMLPSAEQYARLAGAGTRFVLLEQRNFDSSRRVIRSMVDAGLEVELIECYNGDHAMITRNAFRYGVISWALGERELELSEYIPHSLT